MQFKLEAASVTLLVAAYGGGTDYVVNLFGFDPSSRRHKSVGLGALALLADGLGSVRMELVGGAVEATTTYSPYGKELAQEGDSGTAYGFTGEQEDGATGLLYMRARYYSAGLMAFMSRDPWAGDGMRPQSENGWSYAWNNPVNWTDPSGLLTCEAPQAGCAQWVLHALTAIENVLLPIGKQLIQAL